MILKLIEKELGTGVSISLCHHAINNVENAITTAIKKGNFKTLVNFDEIYKGFEYIDSTTKPCEFPDTYLHYISLKMGNTVTFTIHGYNSVEIDFSHAVKNSLK